ncbi:MAG TPA: sulfate permease [Actinospica sp.]|nr:sulfate permease [Actinospica sp.]
MAESTGRAHGIWRHLAPVAPGVIALRSYRRDWLRGDALAGVTVTAYLVPQVMAYATVAGLPPVAGLWAILPSLLVYAVLGSSRLLSVGPESTTALMTAAVVGPLAGGDAGDYAGLAAALAVVLGALCVLAWLARLGFVADLFSRPLLIGYLAGVALVLIVDQLGKFTGVQVGGEGFGTRLWSFLRNGSAVHAGTAAMGAAALLVLFVVAHYLPKVPGPLLVVVLGTTLTAAFGLDTHGLSVIGQIPVGPPHPRVPNLDQLHRLLLPAAGVLLVGYTDVILTARAFEARGGAGRLDANQELLALGTANLGSGFLQGFPVSSSASRTALADSAGAHSQAYALVAEAGVVAVLLAFSPLLKYTPTAVLGALVVFAAIRLIDISAFRRLWEFRRREFLLALGCLIGVLALNVLYGVLVAVGLSVAELLSRVARPHDAVQGLVPGLAGMHDVDDYPEAHTIEGLVVYRYDSPLFFANAQDFRRRALAAVAEQPDPVKWFVLNTEANVEVDITALDAVEALREELTSRGIVFALARVKQDLRTQLDAYGLAASVGENRIYPTLPIAVAAYRTWLRNDGDGQR